MVKPARKCPPGIADRPQHTGRGIVLNLGQAGVLPAPTHQEVDLHVHQAWKQNGVAEVDDVADDLASDADDLVVLDANDPRPDDLAGIDVQ